MNRSTPGLPVHHQFPELAQIHDHRVIDAIQPSYLLSFPSPAFSHSQHQGLFQWVCSFTSGGQSIGVSASASVLPMTIQDWFPLGWTDWISLQSKGLSRVFSNTTVQKHPLSLYSNSAFFIVQLSHPYMTTRKTIDLTRQTFVGTRKKEWGKMLLERRCLFQKVKKKGTSFAWFWFQMVKKDLQGFFSSLSHGNAVSCSRDNQYQLSFMYSSKTVLCIWV